MSCRICWLTQARESSRTTTFLAWSGSLLYISIWLLLFIKVRRGQQTPTAVTGSNDYVRSSAYAPRQQRKTFHYPTVLWGRYLLYHMDYACHLYRSAVSQISLSISWNSHRGIVQKIFWPRKKRNSLKEQSNTSSIHTEFWTLWSCVGLKNEKKTER